jgi:polysaccharide export outer membrane protein
MQLSMQIRSFLMLGLLLALAACAEKGAGPVLSSGDRYATGADAVTDYRLGTGDRIRVAVYNEPALTGEFGVGANGSVALPLIGEVPASGRSVSDFAADARARLADGYLREPKVSAEVTVFRPFFILGEITEPGSYPYAVGLTAMNAVATAKGFTPRANRDVVRIRRQGQTEELNYRLTPELLVSPGDTIRVGERFF